ncbi:unnamed protein product [Spirodela intermedia]|uniref:Uncharacterized protein n=1 Tax=Spirodela intermedia TaxID=51605 RepID=A0A7I8KBX1_SPIIN|nr:unnamed protein product [Spirodela intermedia]
MIYLMDLRSFYRESKVPSLACTTTPCPIVGWPPVTWKGSGVHMPYRSPSQAARAVARGYSPTIKTVKIV